MLLETFGGVVGDKKTVQSGAINESTSPPPLSAYSELTRKKSRLLSSHLSLSDPNHGRRIWW